MQRNAHGDGWADRTYRGFCVAVSVVFLLVAAYTVTVKVPSGEFGRDWMHTVLHVLTGLAALMASIRRSPATASRLFTVAILAVYGVLGTIGWVVDGLALHTVVRVPLQLADNVFHLLIAAAAMGTVVLARREPSSDGSG